MRDNPLLEAPKLRLMQSQLARVDELTRQLESPAVRVDAKRQPRIFVATFGPIHQQRTRADEDADGFLGNAPYVDPGLYLTPMIHNVLVGQNGPFQWCAVGMTADLSWTYTATPGFDAPVNAIPYPGLFSPAIAANGGAMTLDNFTNTQQFADAPIRPRIGVEIDLYDKTRGRSITSSRISPEAFCGLGYGFKALPAPMRFDTGTELEPRLYVTECRMTDALDTDTAYAAADVNVFVTIMFAGYMVLP